MTKCSILCCVVLILIATLGQALVGGSNATAKDDTTTASGRVYFGSSATGEIVWRGPSGPQGYAAICLDTTGLYAGTNGSNHACGTRRATQQYGKASTAAATTAIRSKLAGTPYLKNSPLVNCLEL